MTFIFLTYLEDDIVPKLGEYKYKVWFEYAMSASQMIYYYTRCLPLPGEVLSLLPSYSRIAQNPLVGHAAELELNSSSSRQAEILLSCRCGGKIDLDGRGPCKLPRKGEHYLWRASIDQSPTRRMGLQWRHRTLTDWLSTGYRYYIKNVVKLLALRWLTVTNSITNRSLYRVLVFSAHVLFRESWSSSLRGK